MVSEEDDNDLYIVPVNGLYLFYSPRRKLSALLNKQAIILLIRSLGTNQENQKLTKELHHLVREIHNTSIVTPDPKNGQIDPLFLGIIPTRSCNGACIYCGFGSGDNYSREFMDLDLAVRAVDWMAETVKQNGNDVLEIHFFGGEPTISPEIVEVVIHRARLVAARMKLATHFEVITNGQFDDNFARFAGDYFDVVILSLDGPKDIHNFHRPLKTNPDSYSPAAKNAAWLSKSSAELFLRSCISDLNVERLEEIAHFLCSTFNPQGINFEVLQYDQHMRFKDVRPPDPYLFARHFIRASVVAGKYGIKAIYAAAETDTIRHSFCPVGKDTAIVSPDGRLSSCYLPDKKWKGRGMNLDIGNISTKDTHVDNDALDNIRKLVQDKKRCRKCFCRWSCAGGCHVDNTFPGCDPGYNDFCIQTRIITACRLLFRLNQDELVFSLLANEKEMKTLAMNFSDTLNDFKDQ